MSCLDLLRQQACDMRDESNAASQKYKKSVARGFATTVEEGWELLSQVNMSKRMRMQRKYLMMCNGTPLSSRVTGANLLTYNGNSTGVQFAGTPYQRPMGSIQHGFRAPRAPTVTQQQPHSQQQRPLMPKQQPLSSGSGQWTGGSAVPHGVNVQQQNATDQLPRLHLQNSGAHSQHPETQHSRTMERQMLTQQHNFAGNGHGRWTNAHDTPHRMTLQRAECGQQEQAPHVGAQFVANHQTQIPVERQFAGTKNSFTSPYANSGSHSSVFHTPAATPVGVRNQSHYVSGSMRLQRFTAGNSCLQQNNGSYAPSQPQQKQFYSAAPNRFSQASNNLVPPTLAPRTAAQPQQGIPAVGSFNQPASKPMNSSTGQQAMSENNTYAAQPPQLGTDASDFFSMSEQELDEVLASLADHQSTCQQKMPTTNCHPTTFGTVSNAPPVHGNARKAPATLPTNGAQAIHIITRTSVPAGAEVLEVRESPVHPCTYEVVTTAGTFRAYGQAPVVNQQP